MTKENSTTRNFFESTCPFYYFISHKSLIGYSKIAFLLRLLGLSTRPSRENANQKVGASTPGNFLPSVYHDRTLTNEYASFYEST